MKGKRDKTSHVVKTDGPEFFKKKYEKDFDLDSCYCIGNLTNIDCLKKNQEGFLRNFETKTRFKNDMLTICKIYI